jgi:hypothetical protein
MLPAEQASAWFVFARVFAAVFEIPFLTHQTWAQTVRVPRPRADGVAG